MEYQFSSYVLKPDCFELWCENTVVPLEPKVFRLLLFLVENRHRMVTRNEIIDDVWGGRYTSDASIATGIRTARSALGDGGNTQHTIKTVHGQGFRFVASVATQSGETKTAVPATKISHQSVVVSQNRPAPELVISAANEKPSIAIIPFQYLGNEEQFRHLADAVPHEMIQALSRLRWLFVIARGSSARFRSAQVDVRSIGEQLNVRYVLAGSIEVFNQSLGLTVELSDCRNGEVIWADRIDAAYADIHEIRTQIVAGSFRTGILHTGK